MKSDLGFTLVELMIVIGIAAVMTGIAVFSYITLRPTLYLNGASRQVMGDLMEARIKAVGSNRRFKIFFFNNTQYKRCDDADNNGTVDDGEGDVKITNIQQNYPDVTLSATADPVFQPRGTASISTITLTNTSGSKDVKVHLTGRVKIE